MSIDLFKLQATGLARAFVVIIPVISIVIGIMFRQPIAIYFGLFVSLMDVVNRGVKYGLKAYYGDRETLPILGRGARPEGAMYCGSFVDVDSDGHSTSFGMPSGHAQLAIITAIFWTLYLQNKFGWDIQNGITIGLLWIICVLMAYSRVYLNCHTIQQVIFGGLLGLILGSLGYAFSFE